MPPRALALIVLVACTACGTSSEVARSSPTPTPVATTPPSCAEELWAKLSPTQRAGQLIFLGLVNNRLGPAERTAIQSYGVGSVWFTELTNAPSSYVAGVSAQVQAMAR